MDPYNLFIDDERMPANSTAPFKDEWVIVRSFDECVLTIQELGLPIFISFDHDLGEGKTGHDIAKWLIEKILTENLVLDCNFNFFVHSQNPVGKENIILLLEEFLCFLQKEKARQFKERRLL